MHYYELLYISNSAIDGNKLKQVKADVENLIREKGETIYKTEDWGRTKLAYEIKRERYGNYVLHQFAAPPSLPSELKQRLVLNDAVLSHIITRLEKEPRKQEPPEVEARPEEGGEIAEKPAAEEVAAPEVPPVEPAEEEPETPPAEPESSEDSDESVSP